MASLKKCGFVALDRLVYPEAKALMERLKGRVLGVKFTDLLDGSALEALMCANYNGLLGWADAKLHDIPATVEGRVWRLAGQGASIITVHASGGTEMVKAAVAAHRKLRGRSDFGIAAVTVLTSLPLAECQFVYGDDIVGTTYRLGQNADIGGAFGIVCSPQEVSMMRKEFPHMKLLTPGIRSAGVDANDQARTGTPAAALENGADYLVIGREITQAPDPLEAIARIDESIAHLP